MSGERQEMFGDVMGAKCTKCQHVTQISTGPASPHFPLNL